MTCSKEIAKRGRYLDLEAREKDSKDGTPGAFCNIIFIAELF